MQQLLSHPYWGNTAPGALDTSTVENHFQSVFPAAKVQAAVPPLASVPEQSKSSSADKSRLL
jgi:hypothetical protein